MLMESKLSSELIIQKLSLTNFQIHKDLTLEFAPYTVIAGPSNSGKTSIIRALAKLLIDFPKVGNLVKVGENTAAISAETVWGKLVRVLGSENKVCINEDCYSSFGHDYPVTEILPLQGKYFFSFQFDAPFFFRDTPGKRIEILKEISQFTFFENLQQSINTDLKLLKEELIEVTAQRKYLEEVLSKKDIVAQIRSLYNQVLSLQKELLTLKCKLLSLYLHRAIKLLAYVNLSLFNYFILLLHNSLRRSLTINFSELEKSLYSVQLCKYRLRCQKLSEELSSFKVCPLCGRPL